MPEWPMGAGCKPAGLRLRRFKSFSAHVMRPTIEGLSGRARQKMLNSDTSLILFSRCALASLSSRCRWGTCPAPGAWMRGPACGSSSPDWWSPRRRSCSVLLAPYAVSRLPQLSGVVPDFVIFVVLGQLPIVAASALLLMRSRSDVPAARMWRFLGLATLSLAIGGVLRSLSHVGVISLAQVSVADGFWLAFYPLAGFGLLFVACAAVS